MSTLGDSIIILSNVNLEPIASKISKLTPDSNAVHYDGFNTLALRLHDPNYFERLSQGTTVWIHADFNFPGLSDIDHNNPSTEIFLIEYQNILTSWISTISQFPNIQFLLSTQYFRTRWNKGNSYTLSAEHLQFKCLQFLHKQTRGISNISVYPFHHQIAKEGERNSYDSRLWMLGRIPYSYGFIDYVVKDFVEKLNSTIPKKVLILDLDNTLWGGILDENESSPIQLGNDGLGLTFYTFQKAIKGLKETGILLCVVSKNDTTNVCEQLKNHPFMVLREDDFVEIRANWNSKSENIRQLSKTLSLSTDSFVFIDDNPREREEVALSLPEVSIPDFPDDPAQLEDWFYDEIVPRYFDKEELTNTDRQRTRQYHAKKKRDSEELQSSSFENYLQQLKIKLTVRKAENSELSRVKQLIERSNRFNLNKNDSEYTPENAQPWVLYYEDKFGKEGLVGVAVIEKTPKVTIRKMAISCRVLEKRVEYAFLNQILKKMALSEINLEYRKTEKNAAAAKFLKELHAQKVGKTAEYYYSTSNQCDLNQLSSCIHDAT